MMLLHCMRFDFFFNAVTIVPCIQRKSATQFIWRKFGGSLEFKMYLEVRVLYLRHFS
jgi:hypothetical protein